MIWNKLLIAGLLGLALGTQASAQQIGPLPDIQKGSISVNLKPLATGLGAPDYAISPPGDASRLFVIEQNGLLLVVQNGVLLGTPALDVQSRVAPPMNPANANDERGFLGLAFHPGFNNPGSVGYRTLYTFSGEPIPPATSPTYIAPNAAPQTYKTVVNEWKMTADPNIVDPTSRREIISFGKNAGNHNGGTVAFGPDGYLYLALGDGGNSNDVGASHIEPGGNAQNLSTPLGKMLRIDPVNPSLTPGSLDPISSNGQYRIPVTNPFQGPGEVPEIYAYGLRNPYRYSFDRLNGELILADVGQNNIEEINRITLGGNYGWAVKEGDFLFNRTIATGTPGTIGARSPGLPVGMIDPLSGPMGTLEYDHSDGISITGGFVYRGGAIPELYGKYVFGDLALRNAPPRVDGRIFYADLTSGEILEFHLPQFPDDKLPNGLTVHGFGEDGNGELYALVTNSPANGTGGILYKLTPLPVTETVPTPIPNSAVVKTRIFNDCPSTTVTTVNNYPSLVSIQDAGLDCFGFANLHNWRFSTDGTNPIEFDNNASFRFSSTLKIEGDGSAEAGLQLAPWWSPDVDGRFNVRSTDGEIACFGGRLPFFTFTGAFGLHYAKGNPIHLEVIYEPRGLSSGNPATIEYRLRYLGTDYTSGAIAFDQANAGEDPPHGLWGMLYEAQAGGYVQCFNTPGNPTTAKASWSDIDFSTTPRPTAAVVKTRIFNDCPSSNVTVSNDYPHLLTILDEGLDCFGFANLHNWHFSENGVTDVPFNNDAVFRFSADVTISGDGNGEAGLQISPWYSKDVDGRFNVRSTDGEIACFGGRLPFYSFTGAYGLHYVKGTKIHLEVLYDANGNSAGDPATIEYRVSYNDMDYSSGRIAFDEANAGEDPPYGLWGMLNDGRAGGYAQNFNTPGTPTAVSTQFRNIQFSSCLDPAKALLTVRPRKLNRNSMLPYMTAYIYPQAPLLASQIDVSSLRLNDIPALTSPAPRILNGDHTLKVWFSRAEVLASVTDGRFRHLDLHGEIAGQCLDAVDYIDVLRPKMHHPHKDQQLVAGSDFEVSWDVNPDAQSIKMLSSVDDGATWQVVASNIQNTGNYTWRVPGNLSSSARISLVNLFELDADGVVNEDEYAESEMFEIVSPTGVEGGELTFALRAKNPSTNGIQLHFSLPTAGPAHIAVFDVTGREVLSSEVGGTAGTRSMRVGNGLPAGMYIVQLSAAGRTASSRAVVIR